MATLESKEHFVPLEIKCKTSCINGSCTVPFENRIQQLKIPPLAPLPHQHQNGRQNNMVRCSHYIGNMSCGGGQPLHAPSADCNWGRRVTAPPCALSAMARGHRARWQRRHWRRWHWVPAWHGHGTVPLGTLTLPPSSTRRNFCRFTSVTRHLEG